MMEMMMEMMTMVMIMILPESINKWEADIRLELGADDWDECCQYCTQEPGEYC